MEGNFDHPRVVLRDFPTSAVQRPIFLQQLSCRVQNSFRIDHSDLQKSFESVQQGEAQHNRRGDRESNGSRCAEVPRADAESALDLVGPAGHFRLHLHVMAISRTRSSVWLVRHHRHDSAVDLVRLESEEVADRPDERQGRPNQTHERDFEWNESLEALRVGAELRERHAGCSGRGNESPEVDRDVQRGNFLHMVDGTVSHCYGLVHHIHDDWWKVNSRNRLRIDYADQHSSISDDIL